MTLLLCFYIHCIGISQALIANPTVVVNSIDIINVPEDKPVDRDKLQNCTEIIKDLKELVSVVRLAILDNVIFNTRIADNVILQITLHNREITQKCTKNKAQQTQDSVQPPTQQELTDMKNKLKSIPADYTEYLQILDMMLEIIKLNGVYVLPPQHNGPKTYTLVPASQCIWDKFVELVLVRRYAKFLIQNAPSIKEPDSMHENNGEQIRSSYNNIDAIAIQNSHITKNLFVNYNPHNTGEINNSMQPLEIHHILPKHQYGASIFANYVILTQTNHELLHISDAYQKIDSSNIRYRLNGISTTARKLAKSIVNQVTNHQEEHNTNISNRRLLVTTISDQILLDFYKKSVTITRMHPNTNIKIEYNIGDKTMTLQTTKNDLT